MMLLSRIHFAFSGPCYCYFRNVKANCLSQKELRTILYALSSVKEIQRFKFTNSSNNAAVAENKEHKQIQISLGEKVKQTTKDASYLGVIVVGIGLAGIIFYAVLRELFSGHSPNGVYSEALKLCKRNEQIMDAVGLPIKGFGEETSRGRRRHVSHLEYEKDGVNYMRMKFYIQGSRRKGTVHLEVKENTKKKYEYRYLFVELEGYPQKTIVLEDNRHLTDSAE